MPTDGSIRDAVSKGVKNLNFSELTASHGRSAHLCPVRVKPSRIHSNHPRKYIKTASTRLESPPVFGMSSLLKMLDTYFSTARSVITNWFAMA